MTLDSYRLITTRVNGGEYLTELTFDGKKVDFDLPYNLREIIDEQGLKHIRILANNHNINRLELVISGEDLR